MKAELTLFQKTGSEPSDAGVAKSSGRIPCAGWFGWSGESGVSEEWKMWITSSGGDGEDEERAARKAERRDCRFTS